MSNRNKSMGNGKPSNLMNSGATLAEVVQISRASAEDVVADYHQSQGNLYLSMSIQIELLKDILIGANLITEDELKEKYMEKAKELQEMQRKMMEVPVEPETTASMEMEAGDIEIKTEG